MYGISSSQYEEDDRDILIPALENMFRHLMNFVNWKRFPSFDFVFEKKNEWNWYSYFKTYLNKH